MGMNMRSAEDCYGSENTPHDTQRTQTSRQTRVRSHRLHNAKSEPQCELCTLGDDVVQQVHQLSEMYRLVGNVGNGEGSACVGPEGD